jgi:N6-adenosine-specific RNA methylase IME4|tara:strand:- start:70804 stop:71382 length:579 start_codon:yes stop_codon:yes gene_type:complete
MSEKKYKIIYADPAWSYRDGSLSRGGAKRHYDTMTDEEIKQLPINDIADDDSILFMWATFPKIQEGLDVIKSWGFEYKTIGFVWIKTNKRFNKNQTSFMPLESLDVFWGMGRWTRSNTEICLIGVKGKPLRENADVHSVVVSEIQKHSKKPDEIRDMIVRLCGDLPRVELFARNETKGWDVWGNEVETSIAI